MAVSDGRDAPANTKKQQHTTYLVWCKKMTQVHITLHPFHTCSLAGESKRHNGQNFPASPKSSTERVATDDIQHGRVQKMTLHPARPLGVAQQPPPHFPSLLQPKQINKAVNENKKTYSWFEDPSWHCLLEKEETNTMGNLLDFYDGRLPFFVSVCAWCMPCAHAFLLFGLLCLATTDFLNLSLGRWSFQQS